MADPKNDNTQAAGAAPAKPTPKKDAEYTVVHGSFLVGKGEKRTKGDSIFASELTKAEIAGFLADGSLAKKSKAEADAE